MDDNGTERAAGDLMVSHRLAADTALFLNLAGQSVHTRGATTAWQYGGGLVNAAISAKAPNNPTGQTLVVSVPANTGEAAFISNVQQYRYIAGLIKELSNDRKITIDFTRAWMLFVPRTRNAAEDIPINALGFAGALLVQDRAQLERVRRTGPFELLRRVTAPR